MNSINLTNDKLIEIYKDIREKFLEASPKDEEIKRIYGNIIAEIRRRSLKTIKR